jgi:hypothetical protein
MADLRRRISEVLELAADHKLISDLATDVKMRRRYKLSTLRLERMAKAIARQCERVDAFNSTQMVGHLPTDEMSEGQEGPTPIVEHRAFADRTGRA